jgi:hypothetical protein
MRVDLEVVGSPLVVKSSELEDHMNSLDLELNRALLAMDASGVSLEIMMLIAALETKYK